MGRTRKRSTAARSSERLEDPKKKLTITSDLVIPPTLMGWERELLLPAVVSLVADMIKPDEEPEPGGDE